SETDALFAKLLDDEEFGRKVSSELAALLANLREVAEKLNKGDGSAGRLINDPKFAQALEDIVVGVNESRMLRYLIRNRQKAGIEKRYREAPREPDGESPAPTP
ncbi:MAG TPA: hypothetical protein VI942_03950, partial [Thermoanaerobaculia bacterium]|nr:hypothetical protein [Thermoanaerobaculia bacterium]